MEEAPQFIKHLALWTPRFLAGAESWLSHNERAQPLMLADISRLQNGPEKGMASTDKVPDGRIVGHPEVVFEPKGE